MRAGLKGGRAGLGKREDGASLVEFAFVLPFLLLLILGMVELSFLFAQYNEVRHGVREGARYAAVSRPGSGSFGEVVTVTCDAIGLPNAGITVDLQLEQATSKRLDYATITATASTSSLTKLPFFSSLIPSQLSNSATFRLEQDAKWSPNTGGCP